MISEQDPRGRIKWEIDFPRDNAFVLFLDTEVKITRYLRLDTSGNPRIIVNAKSHHPCDMKKEVLKNLHKTAKELEVKNGYEPRKNYPSAKKKKNKSTEYRAPLKLPYLSDNVSNKTRNNVKSSKGVSRNFLRGERRVDRSSR